MAFRNALEMADAIERERQAIWQHYPDWSEQRRLDLYARKRAEIASAFDNSTMDSRGPQRQQDWTQPPPQAVYGNQMV